MKFESRDETLWALYFESSYNVGYCLMELGTAHEACYYLEISSHSGSYQHVQEYINCLNNSHDPQALEVVENVPVEIAPNQYNKAYMHTKKERMGHTLSKS